MYCMYSEIKKILWVNEFRLVRQQPIGEFRLVRHQPIGKPIVKFPELNNGKNTEHFRGFYGRK